MSLAEPLAEPTTEPGVQRRALWKRALHLVRRTHLYLGLFLFPWAVLYGVTAFLFNHPTVFADAATTAFGADALPGTPLEAPDTPSTLAEHVVAVLNERAAEGARYTLVADRPATFTRDLAFASVRTPEGQTILVAVDALVGGGARRCDGVRAALLGTVGIADVVAGEGDARPGAGGARPELRGRHVAQGRDVPGSDRVIPTRNSSGQHAARAVR